MKPQICVYSDPALADYNFGPDHPFGPDRLAAFLAEFSRRRLELRVRQCSAEMATDAQIARFHSNAYLQQVRVLSSTGAGGYLDGGDTPAFGGMYEAAARVVGTVLAAVREVVAGQCRRAFVPIAGLHHARRDAAAGFCVFNDCGVAIETLRQVHGMQRLAYVDIDAHHADGVFYAFERDPNLCFADLHEDGRFLYPGTGAAHETGRDAAAGSKLNVPLPPGADDAAFARAWAAVEAFVRGFRPEFILLQCGADSMAGDPITHLRYSGRSHRLAAQRLSALAEECCDGRLVALGGGGYNRDNLARAWCEVIEGISAPEESSGVP